MNQLSFNLIKTEKDYQILQIIISGNGIVSTQGLKNLELPNNIETGKGILLFGKAPVWLYAYLIHELHICAWVATFDPRIGGIVVQSHKPESRLPGDIIETDEIKFLIKKSETSKKTETKENRNKVIAFLGPPHSGKSVLLNSLRNEIKNSLGSENYNNDFFIIRGCPDGEGDWFSDISEEEGKLIRQKSNFDDDFPNMIANHIKETTKSKRIVLVDCGGIIDKKNQIILNECSHSIIISSKPELINEWIGAAKASETEILSIIESVLYDTSEVITSEPLLIRLGKLVRGNKTNLEIPPNLIDKIVK